MIKNFNMQILIKQVQEKSMHHSIQIVI